MGEDDSWFWDSIGIDPDTIDYGSSDSPSNEQILQDIGYEDPSTISAVSNFLKTAGSSALNYLKNQFTDPKTGGVNWKSVAAAAGGLYGAYQSQQEQAKTGYQGKIPTYEAVREQVPGTFDPNRRPGSGGQQYLTNVKYAAPGEAATAARAAAKEEAAGLATLNKENPARQDKPTASAVARGEESAATQEGRPASDVIQDRPVPTYAQGGLAGLAKGGVPRYLAGGTDGMADKIPASIDGKQEARLSHGEFVVSADVVSALGGGNSEAGAQRLYSMMDRIRKTAHGRKKQINPVDPKKVLPA